MEIITFIYNIILIILYTVVLSYSVILYLQYKHKLFLLTGILFVFYIFDNIIIYMTEFLDGFSKHYDLQFMNVPAFKTVIIIVSCVCMAEIQHQILPDKNRNTDPVFLVALALILLFSPVIADGALMVWIYYLPCQLFTFYLGTSGLLYLKQHKEILETKKFLKYYRQILSITVLFSILILIEDTIVIFSIDIYSDILVKINNRSFSEDVMSILFSIFAVRQMSLYLCRKQEETQAAAAAAAAAAIAAETRSASPGQSKAPEPEQEALFLYFTQEYHLTAREQDILRVLLKDKNNQEISDELFISVGTVKTHVHNIFQKANVSKRSQLLRLYEEYAAKKASE